MRYAEKLARALHAGNNDAICPMWGGLDQKVREVYEAQATALLAAIAALAERGGPKLVAREPTAEMADAPTDRIMTAGMVWRKMHDAAPAVPEGT